jgi:hypothetical protein
MRNNTSLLRGGLSTNALFSAACGIASIAASNNLATQLSVPEWVLQPGGALLIAYGLGLAALSRVRRVASAWSIFVTALDYLWVVASAIFLKLHETPNPTIILVQGTVVLVLAEIQLLGIRNCIFTNGTGTFSLERVVNASADRAWIVMSDVAHYADVAKTLRSSDISSGEGLGMVRKCEDKNGVCWAEKCVRWEPGQAYAFEVDTSGPDYPLPLKTMRGDFEVEPLGTARSVIRIRFTFKPRGGLVTELFIAVLFATRGDALICEILDRWARLIETEPGSSDNWQVA